MPDSIFRSYYSVETVLGMINQFHSLINLPYTPDVSTTINTKYGVFSSAVPTAVPTVKYFGIGIKGYYNIDDGVLSQPYKPNAANMDIYQPLPFRCVPIDEDLTTLERTNYRMRTRITVGELEYYAYWLKLLTFPSDEITLTRIEPDGTETPYVLDPANLTPIPVQDDTPDVIDPTANSISVSVASTGIITGEEVMESISVLHGGDARLARISEYGFYTGEDKAVSGTDHLGNPLPYTEAMYVQLSSHRCSVGTDMSDLSSYRSESIKFCNGNVLVN